ncbi:uncharacterized protein [Periplaneta americana]|uniref:uncharacterized protein isoform X2 n=1 Tax=Periplaneta americana TaxID=6978 RepID=UPI0037E8CC25
MDVIKAEPEVDPLAIEASDDTGLEEKPLSQEGNSWNPLLTKIKTKCEDHSHDVTSGMKLEDTAVPIISPVMKYEAEEESCDVDIVKEELWMQATTQESEVMAESKGVDI